MARHLQNRRSRRSREGTAAVEFGIVALPFFALMFAIFELGLIFVVSSVLENAVMETSRLVRTGQASARNFDAAAFKNEVCGRMSIFAGDCRDRASIDVREVPKFDGANLPNPLATGTMRPEVLTYQGGQPGSLMVVRAWYRQPIITPFLARAVERDGRRTMLTATTAFRNEPWGWGSGATP